jgi:nitrate/nitrite transporter NarK
LALAAFAGAGFGEALAPDVAPLLLVALAFVALAFVAVAPAVLLAAAFFGAARLVFELSETVEEVAAFMARPEPLFLPPPSCLLTVAQARLSASPSGTPRSS